MAALAVTALNPGKIKDMFLEHEANKAGIYTVKYYMRGKQWVFNIDDIMLTSSNLLMFAQIN